ncbi:MAG: bifunctional DNA-formamidopyrimidine glycosylase/DNA-(apurinic or apyrimidinic site) lyase [bacterium]|nr:bifunctional DNA-formamidopyrimidine glycosylase/DNA-(apurinic or apyrimidinic site) lyase [bacterium]
MPELPEVETTKEGIKNHLLGQYIQAVIVRNSKLRIPVLADINELCSAKQIVLITRRAKYIILHLSQGYIIIHLGMAGHLRVLPNTTSANKHDHIDLVLSNNLVLRFCDPRRFGLFHYLDGNPNESTLLAHLGPEPLSKDFNAEYLYKKAQLKNLPIKSFIMNNEIVVGVGNIYATESLFLTGIHPNTITKTISYPLLAQLTGQIKQTLEMAIKSGGTTLRDFYSFDGKPGYFTISLQVYGRRKQPCFQCNNTIESIIIGGRHSAFCPQCQPLSS